MATRTFTVGIVTPKVIISNHVNTSYYSYCILMIVIIITTMYIRT
jgi:hypothetical protein